MIHASSFLLSRDRFAEMPCVGRGVVSAERWGGCLRSVTPYPVVVRRVTIDFGALGESIFALLRGASRKT